MHYYVFDVSGWEACGEISTCSSHGTSAERRKSGQETTESGFPWIVSVYVLYLYK